VRLLTPVVWRRLRWRRLRYDIHAQELRPSAGSGVLVHDVGPCTLAASSTW
jgi:membrane protein YdbS with pleckstrin-like domain